MQLRESRIGLALVAMGALATLLVLAGGLPGLEFRAAGPLPAPAQPAAPDGASTTDPTAVWAKIMLGGTVLGVTTLIAASLAALSRRKRKFGYRPFDWSGLVILGAFFLVLALWRPTALTGLAPVAFENTPIPVQPETRPSPETALVNPGAAPGDGLVYSLSLGLALLLIFIGGWGIRRLRPPVAATAVEPPAPRLAQTALAAVEELRSGGDWQNAVIRCYQEMSEIVAQYRGLRRQAQMTPREFIRAMAAAGLPDAPLEQLTALFESVRYGPQTPNTMDEAKAEACLTALAGFFQAGSEVTGHAS